MFIVQMFRNGQWINSLVTYTTKRQALAAAKATSLKYHATVRVVPSQTTTEVTQ